jgi:fructokinase
LSACHWDILCAGELLGDCWPDSSEHPGGAPANVAFHARALGARAALISRVGSDERGTRLKRWLGLSGLDADLCQTDAEHPSGLVEVGLSVEGVPVYDIKSPAAWDFLQASDRALAAARRARAFVFGTLSQRHPAGRSAIRVLVEAARDAGACAMADLNLRAPFFDSEIILWTLRHCDLLKLNRGELAEVSGMLGARGDEEDLFCGLLREFGVARGALTAGSDGAWIFEEGQLTHEPADSGALVVDPVGAGDAFCAGLAVGLASGQTLRASASRAARAAAFVVSHQGATSTLPPGI